MNKFIKDWYKISKEKNTNICAGLDPAVFEMGRGEKGLPKGVDKLKWSLDYIEAVAPYVVAIKPNIGYFGDIGDKVVLKKIVEKIHKLGLLAIIDSKISDIGSTSDSYIFYHKKLGFDALTIAPYAGNVEELIKYGENRDIAIITMGLMSNPEYKTEMNFKNEDGTSLWQKRVERAIDAGVSGLVVGGTFKKDDKDFLKFIELTNENEVLYLVPGIGIQGGEISEFLASGIKKEKCIINSGRKIMFPNGSNSTKQEQAIAAKKLRDDFNKYR